MGPVYFLGGSGPQGKRNIYFDVTFFTDPSVDGVVLVRGQRLDARGKIGFVGPWATGAVVANDTIGGQQTTLRAEVELPGGRPASKAGVAPGWGLWEVRLGIDQGDAGFCLGFQVDVASSSELFVVAG